MIVVLDAGHGYGTPGKRTPDGMREYEFNREVAEYAKQELTGYHDVEVRFTHSDERDVPLKERTANANAWGARAFVSIHANAFGNGGWNTAQGIETYCPVAYSPNSNRLANTIHSRLIHATGRKDRGIKSADFHVLRETNMASILCECGFMTSLEEARLLKSDSYRRLCAHAITKGVVEYFNLMLKTTSTLSSVLYKVQVGAFRSKQNADHLAKKLTRKGFTVYVFKEENLYKVQVGAFSEKDNADRLARALSSQGYSTFIIQ
ncbi:N-acetylmuramoyl-L-alanine amidase [Sutcliffiella horikoshii]|uniref:N-acetylmuramoyl-L-alanine amidase n=1 Tax=Sutcliffiella horikoshii TaxID=79883 RepID=A0A5D4T6K2_9BACI|nr:N-acetylmuramoyl-L-alanine amidase [Sutcliffiella horikoshii]TYS69836.1 N-acetylmuramoyl-L-alanine amidase [Sutcliffiella horikoshii]